MRAWRGGYRLIHFNVDCPHSPGDLPIMDPKEPESLPFIYQNPYHGSKLHMIDDD